MFFAKGFVVVDIDYGALVYGELIYMVWGEGHFSLRNRSQLLQDSFLQTHDQREELSSLQAVRRTSRVSDQQ